MNSRFTRGEDVGDLDALVERLRRWLNDHPHEGTIGEGRRVRWVHFRVSNRRCHLNSDTTSAGVKAFLARIGKSVEVGLTRRQNYTKILVGGEAIPGFYA